MTEGVFHSILGLRSSLVFSSFHSGALRRLRTDIQHLGFQIVCSGPGPSLGPAPCTSAACSALFDPDLSALAGSCLEPDPSLGPAPCTSAACSALFDSDLSTLAGSCLSEVQLRPGLQRVGRFSVQLRLAACCRRRRYCRRRRRCCLDL
jgi:hypothetical protein